MRRNSTTQLWNELTQPVELGRFEPERLVGLPAVARRFLGHAIQPGAKLASFVLLQMTGFIRLGKKWLPFEAEEVLAPPRGFVWRAKIRNGLLRISGADHYAAGNGGVDFRLWSLIPVAQASGPDISRAARGRLAAEAFWLPSSLLPGAGVEWHEVDDQTAEVVVNIDGEPVPARLSVDPYGRLRSSAVQRWGDQTPDKKFSLIPFGGEVGQERQFGNYTIPTQVRVGWCDERQL